jgi:hypothetical protein
MVGNVFAQFVAPRSAPTVSYATIARSKQLVSTSEALMTSIRLVKMMITDINKFNELECKQRNDKIAATHNYVEFNDQM